MKLFQSNKPETQTEMRKLFRNVSEKKAERFDQNIKKKIANDGNKDSINNYIADELRDKKARGLCLSIRNCIKRAPKSTVPGQHRFGFEKPCFCSL